jgi:hypothetical protein
MGVVRFERAMKVEDRGKRMKRISGRLRRCQLY